jgi:hypothetical protein
MLIVHLRTDLPCHRRAERDHPLYGRGQRPVGTVEDVPDDEAKDLIREGHAIAATPPAAAHALPLPAGTGEPVGAYCHRIGLRALAAAPLFPSDWTLRGWHDDAPTDAVREPRVRSVGRRLAGIGSSWVDGPGERVEWAKARVVTKLEKVRQAHAERRRHRLAAELFDRLRLGEWHAQGVLVAADAVEPRPVEPSRWAQPFMGLFGRQDGAALEPTARRGFTPSPPDARAIARLVLFPRPFAAPASSDFAAPPRASESPEPVAGGGRKGGRPQRFNRVKISNELRRRVEKDPDGLPEAESDRRELVRDICERLFGEQPADSTLAEIMDDLELRGP